MIGEGGGLVTVFFGTVGLLLVVAAVGRFVVFPISRTWRCPHLNVRCTHGDEIIGRGWRRRICRDCGRALDGPLPEPCSVTGVPHAVAPTEIPPEAR